jgi:hypothetical protein
MWKKIMLFILLCFFVGCSSQSKQPTYKELFNEDERAAERYTTEFLEEARKECPDIINDLDNLKNGISQAKRLDSKDMLEKKQREYKWLKDWADRIDCAYDKTRHERPSKKEDKPASEKDKNVVAITFDECFTRCKELTSRENEKCFDLCLSR